MASLGMNYMEGKKNSFSNLLLCGCNRPQSPTIS